MSSSIEDDASWWKTGNECWCFAINFNLNGLDCLTESSMQDYPELWYVHHQLLNFSGIIEIPVFQATTTITILPYTMEKVGIDKPESLKIENFRRLSLLTQLSNQENGSNARNAVYKIWFWEMEFWNISNEAKQALCFSNVLQCLTDLFKGHIRNFPIYLQKVSSSLPLVSLHSAGFPQLYDESGT